MSRPAVVIVAFHRPSQLGELLGALASADLETVVVNVEADPAVARVCADGGVRCVPLAGNVGYAAAVNAGVATTAAEMVAFMNDDLVIDGGDVSRLVGVVAAGD